MFTHSRDYWLYTSVRIRMELRGSERQLTVYLVHCEPVLLMTLEKNERKPNQAAGCDSATYERRNLQFSLAVGMCATGRSCRMISSTEQQVYGGITAGSPLRDLNHFTLNSQSDDSDPEMETDEPCTDDGYYHNAFSTFSSAKGQNARRQGWIRHLGSSDSVLVLSTIIIIIKK